MPAVFKALVLGLKQKGDGGVLWVKGDKYCYCFPEDFKNAEFAYGIRALLKQPNASSLFFVVSEREGKADVVCYERERVFRGVEEEMQRIKEQGEQGASKVEERVTEIGED